MSKNIYVGNLSFQTTPDDLLQLFGPYGSVERAQVVNDHETGRSPGFGFVAMSQGGEAAIAALNGVQHEGRALTVNETKPARSAPRSASVGSRRDSY